MLHEYPIYIRSAKDVSPGILHCVEAYAKRF